MPEIILFVQLYFAIMVPYLFAIKITIFPQDPCFVQCTEQAVLSKWDACSIFLFNIIWKHVVQCFIYSLSHRLCSGYTECHISLSPLLSPSSLQYIVLNFFGLVFPTTPIIAISSRFCPLNLDFFWAERQLHQTKGWGQIPSSGRQEPQSCNGLVGNGRGKLQALRVRKKMKKHLSLSRHHPQLLTKSAVTTIWCGIHLCRCYVRRRAPEARRSPLVLPERDMWGFPDPPKAGSCTALPQ